MTQQGPSKQVLRTVQVRRNDMSAAGIKVWALDFPANERLVDLGQPSLTVQGWALWAEAPAPPPRVVVESGGVLVHEQPFNSKRPDVIERVLHEPPAGHGQLCCGFVASVSAAGLAAGFRVGVKQGDGEPVWLAQVAFVAPLQVLEGSDGWLFLDNDSNHSVDQYTGKRLLSADELGAWRDYLGGVHALAQRMGLRHAMVLAPSKEEVLRHRYPHERAATTVLDQVCALAAPEWKVLDAAPVLGAHVPPEACFKQTDTHWTDRGAMLATLAVLPHLGVDVAQAQALFAQDVYEVRNEVGDLGCKLLPVRSAPTEFLQGPALEAGAVFDNRLPNIGRTLVFENAGALHPFKVVVFGASSGYPMLKYLKRIFSRVVFVHSAAQVDVDVVDYEKPDALLLQSNGRFLVQAPHMRFSLADAVRTKLSEASPALKNSIREWLATMPANPSEKLYREMLLSAYELQ